MPQLAFFTRVLDEAPPAERYRRAVEQIQHAERYGLRRAWVAQHHFHEREGGLPSPLVLLSHAAARTTAIRLGTGVVTLPLEHPVRVAEDAIVADLLSGGRVDLGVGSGTTPDSFVPFGEDVARKSEVFAEKLGALHAALEGGDVGAGNALYPPAGGLRGRVWQATFSVGGGASAGRHGNGLLLSRTQPPSPGRPESTLAELQHPIVDAYLGHLPAGARPRVTASRSVFVADDRAEALRFAAQGLRRLAELFGREIDASSPATLVATADTYVGTPDDVAEALAADGVLDRADEIAVQAHSVDPPHDFVLRSIELLATEVAPRLGWADAPAVHTTPGGDR